MLNILQSIFGGSKEKSQSSSTPVDMNPFAGLRPEFQTELSSWLKSMSTDASQPATPGVTAPIGANEQSVLDQLMTSTSASNPRNQLLNKTMQGDFLPGGSSQNPFLQASIEAAQRPTFQALEETLGRTLPGRFAVAGQQTQPQSSSAFDRAAAIATRSATQAAADIATNISASAYNKERDLQTAAVPLSQAEVDTSIKNLQAQALPRLISELGIERGLAEFQSRTQSLLQLLQLIGGVTAPAIANQQQSTGEKSSQNSAFGQLFPKGITPTLF